jgi:hypothetical protein
MWRVCDLHTHTGGDDSSPRMTPEQVIRAALEAGIEVLAVTDHGSTDAVRSISETAAGTTITIIPGVEVETTSGHVLALAPGERGQDALHELISRCGIREGASTMFEELVAVAREGHGQTTGPFAESIILIGAHVDQTGSLLASGQPLPLEGQLAIAKKLDGLEVVSDATRQQWLQSGVKGSGFKPPLLRSSDSHRVSDPRRVTVLYLPEVDFRSFRQAFCVPEASIRFERPAEDPGFTIESVSFVGGMHDGVTLLFDRRTNALIGPPLSGKSVVLDAMRFAFGNECDIVEIAETSASRLGRALGEGSIVRVTGAADGIAFQLERTWGGSQAAEPPFQPIIFSQTELVRRGMESRPSMALLDVHCAPSAGLKGQGGEATEQATALFGSLVESADQARALRGRVGNPVDGLQATRARIGSLGGSESVARRAGEVARVRAWRDRVREEIRRWVGEVGEPSQPSLPQAPAVEPEVMEMGRFLPEAQMTEVLEQYRSNFAAAARRAAEDLIANLDASEDTLRELERELSEALEQLGFEEGSAILEELRQLRVRFEVLEAELRRLEELERTIDDELEELKRLIAQRADIGRRLRDARNSTCTQVNASMRSFFARLEQDRFPEELDRLLEEAKTGTYQRASRMPEVRASLDRDRLVETAVRHRQGRDELIQLIPEMEAQDSIARTAIMSNFYEHLPRIAMMWPEDGLVLTARAEPNDRFENLPEGLRALAIKEISFAASSLPVITDQPEDAVPPQNVFQNLVPTIRHQRVGRQFILASHDANIVVAGDIDRIFVMSPGNPPSVGTLFESETRDAAMEVLEGGRDAFTLRGRRYENRPGGGEAH